MLITSGACSFSVSVAYAAFFCCPALSLAHLAFWNAEIFLRADGDMVCFAGAEGFAFTIPVDRDSFLALAHRARCACAILRREAAEIIRVGADVTPVGWLVVPDALVPFNDSMTAIA